jgi:hypothetical protein
MSNDKKKDIQEDDTERVLKLYEEKSKNFNRSLGLLLGFAVFFLFLIFILSFFPTIQYIFEASGTVSLHNDASSCIQV